MRKASSSVHTLSHIIESTQERAPSHALSAGKASKTVHTSSDIGESTLERDPTDALSAEKAFVGAQVLSDIRESTQASNATNILTRAGQIFFVKYISKFPPSLYHFLQCGLSAPRERPCLCLLPLPLLWGESHHPLSTSLSYISWECLLVLPEIFISTRWGRWG